MRARANPAPTSDLALLPFFHGTSHTESGKRILRDGAIRPREDSGAKDGVYKTRGQFTPVAGRVYLSPYVAYATIYALGGVYAGRKMPRDHYAASGTFGYVFAASGAALGDVDPDEDSVGEVITGLQRPAPGPYATPLELAVRARGDDVFGRLFHLANRVMTPKQRAEIRHGAAGLQAAVGKKVVAAMGDDLKLALMECGAHVAHRGAVPFVAAWRLDKRKASRLAEDGSNFVEIAELLR